MNGRSDMNVASERDLRLRKSGRGFIAMVATIFLTGVIVLGTPQQPAEQAQAAQESAPQSVARAEAPATTHEMQVYSPEGMPWQWEADPSDASR